MSDNIVKDTPSSPPVRPILTSRRASKIEMLTGESQENIEKFQMMQKAYKKLGIFDNKETPQTIEQRRSSLSALPSESSTNSANEEKSNEENANEEAPKSSLLKKLGVTQQELDQHLATIPRRSSLPSIHEANSITVTTTSSSSSASVVFDPNAPEVETKSPSKPEITQSVTPSTSTVAARPLLSSRRASKIELLTGESEEMINKFSGMQKAYKKLGIFDDKPKNASPPSSPSLITSNLSPSPSSVIAENSNGSAPKVDLNRRPSKVDLLLGEGKSLFDRMSMKFGINSN